MRDIDNILNKPYNDQGAYKVPEGYFEQLNQRIMDSLPEEQTGGKTVELHKEQRKGVFTWRYARLAVAAAVAAVAVTSATLYLNRATTDAPLHAQADSVGTRHGLTAVAADSGDEYMQECMDYAMIDGDDVVAYVSEL